MKLPKKIILDGVRFKRVKLDGKYTMYYVSKHSGDVYRYDRRKDSYIECKQTPDKDGYMKVGITKPNGKRTNIAVHRLVAFTYKINYLPFIRNEVNHKDGNPENNDSSNLEWCTRRENMRHAWKTGLTGTGKKSSDHKLTDEMVHTICKLLQDTDMKYKDIVEYVGEPCTVGMVKNLLYNKGWPDISNLYDFSKRQAEIKKQRRNKLTKKKVKKICKLLATHNYTSRQIADKLGVTISQVDNIRYGSTWKSISSKYNI